MVHPRVEKAGDGRHLGRRLVHAVPDLIFHPHRGGEVLHRSCSGVNGVRRAIHANRRGLSHFLNITHYLAETKLRHRGALAHVQRQRGGGGFDHLAGHSRGIVVQCSAHLGRLGPKGEIRRCKLHLEVGVRRDDGRNAVAQAGANLALREGRRDVSGLELVRPVFDIAGALVGKHRRAGALDIQSGVGKTNHFCLLLSRSH